MSDYHKFLLVRSARKTLMMVMKEDGALVVRSPRHTPIERIRQFVTDSTDWIERKRARMLSRPQPRVKSFTDGEEFLLLGRLYPLRLSDNAYRIGIIDNELICPRLWLELAAVKLVAWYKNEARRQFNERCTRFAPIIGVEPRGFRLTSPDRRWGSCGSKGTLNFNWRLVMAPPEVIDYVVVHEMIHLKHFNHSPEFWKAVESLAPDFKRHQAWLKTNKHRLII